MIRVHEVRQRLDGDKPQLLAAIAELLRIEPRQIQDYRIHKRAIDARKRGVVFFQFTVDVKLDPKTESRILSRGDSIRAISKAPEGGYEPPVASSADTSSRPVVVGAGPCGLFATLLLARAGRNPILLERGKAAGDRARDVTGFWRRGAEFDPTSNVQFGEGGAGTFSDGKLYTQIRDPDGRIPWLLRELVAAGAPEDILIKARPHIGTDRLIKVIRHMRQEIGELGGDIRFGSQLTDMKIEKGRLVALGLGDGSWIETDTCILAPGHSARDTFAALHAAGVPFEPKSFSMGVRIEHPQSVIDQAQYGRFSGHPRLGSAPYKFAAKTRHGRSAYSFCMCPGGLVVAASSEEGTVVTNGMSSYARAEANANAGFMVEVTPEEIGATVKDPLAGIEFQRKWERKAFEIGGGNYHAPAQKLGDFLKHRASKSQGSVAPSYEPGVTWTDLRECLPDTVASTLQASVRKIATRLKGFDLPDAVMTGVETRSSSPVRIPRDSETMECVSVAGLYPAGEGAGYAGGIISAAADGLRVAEAVLS